MYHIYHILFQGLDYSIQGEFLLAPSIYFSFFHLTFSFIKLSISPTLCAMPTTPFFISLILLVGPASNVPLWVPKFCIYNFPKMDSLYLSCFNYHILNYFNHFSPLFVFLLVDLLISSLRTLCRFITSIWSPHLMFNLYCIFQGLL